VKKGGRARDRNRRPASLRSDQIGDPLITMTDLGDHDGAIPVIMMSETPS
jgi:hypothetical protein